MSGSKTPILLASLMAILVAVLIAFNFEVNEQVSVQEGKLEDVPESLRTYTPPPNIYLPDLSFLRIDQGDSYSVETCKNMTFRSVDDFSRQVNSNLVRNDKKLHTLARVIYHECLELQIAMVRGK